MSWNKKLEQKYIHLFDVYNGEETETSYYKKGDVLRGIEAGVGWKKPVEKFLEACQFHLDHNAVRQKDDGSWEKDPDAKIMIFQIKEKFGSVRCYVDINNQRLDLLIDCEVAKLEARCELTCESCGFVGDFKKAGSSLCDKCRAIYN